MKRSIKGVWVLWRKVWPADKTSMASYRFVTGEEELTEELKNDIAEAYHEFYLKAARKLPVTDRGKLRWEFIPKEDKRIMTIYSWAYLGEVPSNSMWKVINPIDNCYSLAIAS